jgi:hypothetical protein
MLVVRELTIASGKVIAVRLIGAGIAGIGIAILAQHCRLIIPPPCRGRDR